MKVTRKQIRKLIIESISQEKLDHHISITLDDLDEIDQYIELAMGYDMTYPGYAEKYLFALSDKLITMIDMLNTQESGIGAFLRLTNATTKVQNAVNDLYMNEDDGSYS